MVAVATAEDPRSDLMIQTAKLALATARQVQQLQAAVLRTISIPDSRHYGVGLTIIARQDHPYSENSHAMVWAQLILLLTETPPLGAVNAQLQHLCTHVVVVCTFRSS